MNVGVTEARALALEEVVVVDHQLLAAGAAAEDDADVRPVLVGDLEARVGDGLLGRGDAELGARLGPPGLLRIEPVERVEALDLAGGLGRIRLTSK